MKTNRDHLLSLALLLMVIVVCWAVTMTPPVEKPRRMPEKFIRLMKGLDDRRHEDVLSPHQPGAKHPPGVDRIMALLPEIDRDAEPADIERRLGLKSEPDGGVKPNNSTFDVFWNIAPGYHLVIGYYLTEQNGKPTWRFYSLSVAAQNRPRFPPDQYHTIFPYRDPEGLVYEQPARGGDR